MIPAIDFKKEGRADWIKQEGNRCNFPEPETPLLKRSSAEACCKCNISPFELKGRQVQLAAALEAKDGRNRKTPGRGTGVRCTSP